MLAWSVNYVILFIMRYCSNDRYAPSVCERHHWPAFFEGKNFTTEAQRTKRRIAGSWLQHSWGLISLAEGEQVGGELVGVGEHQAVWGACVHFELTLGDQARGTAAGKIDRSGNIGVAMDDQSRDVKLWEFRTKIRFGVRYVAVDQSLERGLLAHLNRPGQHGLAGLRRKEWACIVFEPLGKIRFPGGAKPFEVFAADAVGIVRRLQSEGQRWGDEDDAGNAAGSVPGCVTHNFATAHRVPDQDNVSKTECLDHVMQIIGERVVVETAARIAGASVPTLIVGDTAEPAGAEVNHLVLPQVGVNGPAVDKKHGFAGSPFLIKKHGTIAGFSEW